MLRRLTRLKNAFGFRRYASTTLLDNTSKFVHQQPKTNRKYLYFFPTLCTGLGFWQVYRLYWKRDLIDQMQERLQLAPIRLDTSIRTDLSQYEHRRVTLSGQFLHEFEMLVGPRNKGGPGRPGFFVYTPLLLDDDSIVIVNRGWVPKAYASRESRIQLNKEQAMPEGRVHVHGMLRQPKYYQPRSVLKSMFLPSPRVRDSTPTGQLASQSGGEDVDDRQWLWLDLDGMIKWMKAGLGSAVSKIPQVETSYFIEEVLDTDAAVSEDDDQSSEMLQEMMEWHKEGERLKHANETMPTILASVKAIQTDPRMFFGKPIIAPPSINVSNKHLEYVYTWFSLAGFLLVTIFLTSRRKPSIPTRLKQK